MAYNLESLVQILEEILHPDDHDLPWILDHGKKPLIESLLAKTRFLKDFFDNSSLVTGREVRRLESQIRDASYHAETVIQSHLVEQLLLQKKGERIIITPPDLLQVIEDHEFERIFDEMARVMDGKHARRPSSSHLVSQREDFNPKNIVVGISEDLMRLKDWLTSQQSKLEIMPIVGMGGIGKTTLAQTLYHDPIVGSHFDARAWVVISQSYSVQEILLGLLKCVIGEPTNEMMEDNGKVAERLHEALWGRRYLIVLDDIWSFEAWDNIKSFFSDENNGSRILVTTRELSVANYASSCDLLHQMKFLKEGESLNLLRWKVFAEENFPLNLEVTSKIIAKNCKGLPLAIHVVGGVLARLEKTGEAWAQIAEDLHSSTTNIDEHFSNIFSLSYVHLPNYLKPCFLYMSVFPEDDQIQASKLVMLWVAEGFLKPIHGKSLEDAAELYLEELVQRNLLLVSTQETKRKVKRYAMHDSLRQFCIQKAEEEKFFHFVIGDIGDFNLKEVLQLRRLSVHAENQIRLIAESQGLANVMHSLLFLGFPCGGFQLDQPTVNGIFGLRLLRVLDILKVEIPELPKIVEKLVNLRYLAAFSPHSTLPSSISSLCNLQTLIYHSNMDVESVHALFQIPRLRHVKFKGCYLHCDLFSVESIAVQENLQTLSTVAIDNSFPKIFAAIPNIKKLGIFHHMNTPNSCTIDLRYLTTLETLQCTCFIPEEDRYTMYITARTFLQYLIFPCSLTKLTLRDYIIPLGCMGRIGALPNLQILKLRKCKFDRLEWEQTEGKFCNLVLLVLEDLHLVKWIMNDTHFPKLEELIIRDCGGLKEIPSSIGQIPTLEIIDVHGSMTASALKSLRDIQDEQVEYGNNALQVRYEGRAL